MIRISRVPHFFHFVDIFGRHKLVWLGIPQLQVFRFSKDFRKRETVVSCQTSRVLLSFSDIQLQRFFDAGLQGKKWKLKRFIQFEMHKQNFCRQISCRFRPVVIILVHSKIHSKWKKNVKVKKKKKVREKKNS